MKFPKDAKRVFQGVIYDVYHWPQKTFDGSVKTYEGLKRVDSVNIIGLTADKKIIIGHQEQPVVGKFVGMLGGQVDPGEDHLTAAKREFLEESGYVSDDWELWGTIEPVPKYDWVVYNYIARNCQRKQEQELESGERIELELVDFEKFLEIVAREDFRDTEVALTIMRLEKDPKKLAEFKQRLFK